MCHPPGILKTIIITAIFGLLSCGCTYNPWSNNDALKASLHPVIACDGLDLSSSKFSPGKLRSLVNCLNRHQDIEPLRDFVSELSDEELKPWSDWLEHVLFSPPNRLAALKMDWELLKEKGYVDYWFKKLEGLRNFRETRFQLAHLLNHGELNRFSVETPNLVQFIRVMFSILKAESFQSFVSELKRMQISDAQWDEFIQYLSGNPESFQPLKNTLELVASGSFFQSLDQFFGSTPNHFTKSIPRIVSLFDYLLNNNAKRFSDYTSFFHLANQPADCLDLSLKVNSGADLAMREIARNSSEKDIGTYFERKLLMDLLSFHTFCDIPEGYEIYGELTREAISSGQLRTAVDLFGSFTSGAMGFFNAFMSDGDIAKAIPVFADVNRVGGWSDFWLVLNYPARRERNHWQTYSQKLLKPAQEIGGRSWMDWLLNYFQDSSIRTQWIRVFRELGTQIHAEDPEFVSKAYETLELGTDQHPLLEVVRDTILGNGKTHRLLVSLEQIHKKPNLPKVDQWFFDTAREGKLERIISSFFDLVKANQDEFEITQDPILGQILGRHNLSGKDLTPFHPVPIASYASPSCRHLQLQSKLSSYQTSLVGPRFFDFIDCIVNDSESGGATYELGANAKLGGALYERHVDFFKILSENLTTPETAEAVKRLLISEKDGRLKRWFKAFSSWVGTDQKTSALYSFLGAMRAVAPEGDSIRLFEKWIARILRFDRLDLVVRASRKVSELPQSGAIDAARTQIYPEKLVRSALQQTECITEKVELDKRVQDIFDDAALGKTNHEWIRGAQRRYWSQDELEDRLRPLTSKLVGPAHPVMDAFLGTLKTFSKAPSELVAWLRIRAQKWNQIIYFFPGEKRARVRLVNSLDELELVLLNANITLPWGENMALKYLGMIADSWGDEPQELWPEEIRLRYPDGSAPKLRQTVEDIFKDLARLEKWIGYPKLKRCEGVDPDPGNDAPPPGWVGGLVPRDFKSRLFNLRQIVGVLTDNLPDAANSQAGGLRVLRNLFYHFYYSTPEEFRNPQSGDDNHLTEIVRLVQMGFIRQISRSLAFESAVDRPATDEMIKLLPRAANLEVTERLLEQVLSNDPKQPLFWNLWEQYWNGRWAEADAEASFHLVRTAFAMINRATELNVKSSEGLASLPVAISWLSAAIESEGQKWTTGSFPKLSQSRWIAYVDQPLNLLKQEEAISLFTFLTEIMQRPEESLSIFKLLHAVEKDPKAQASWEEFIKRSQLLIADRNYERLDIPDLWMHLIEAIEEESMGGTNLFMKKLRMSMADWIEPSSSDYLNGLVKWMSQRELFYAYLKGLQKAVDRGDIEEFFSLASRTFSVDFP